MPGCTVQTSVIPICTALGRGAAELVLGNLLENETQHCFLGCVLPDL